MAGLVHGIDCFYQQCVGNGSNNQILYTYVAGVQMYVRTSCRPINIAPYSAILYISLLVIQVTAIAHLSVKREEAAAQVPYGDE